MKGFPKFPKGYFKRFSTNPVKVKPFNPQSKQIAQGYIQKLKSILSSFKIDYLHRGSTAFEIAGKGDIEIGIYPHKNDWDKVLQTLKAHFGKINKQEKDYARINDQVKGFEIEIMVMTGDVARIDRKLTSHLLNSPQLLKEYEKLKKKYSYSRREYQREKDKFLRRIIKSI